MRGAKPKGRVNITISQSGDFNRVRMLYIAGIVILNGPEFGGKANGQTSEDSFP